MNTTTTGASPFRRMGSAYRASIAGRDLYIRRTAGGRYALIERVPAGSDGAGRFEDLGTFPTVAAAALAGREIASADGPCEWCGTVTADTCPADDCDRAACAACGPCGAHEATCEACGARVAEWDGPCLECGAGA